MITTKELNYSWLRQPKEPETVYKWFTYYKDMKGIRRLNKVVKLMKEKEPYLERYPSYNEVKKASSNWKWKQRTIDYDNYMQLQLIEDHKQTLIIYEEESINIDKKIYNALNIEIDKLLKNDDITPDKKIRAFKEAQLLNKELLSGIEHIANIEVPQVNYIDVTRTIEEEVIDCLIKHSQGIVSKETLEDRLEGFKPEEVKDIIIRYINRINSNPIFKNTDILKGTEVTVIYDKETFYIPAINN